MKKLLALSAGVLLLAGAASAQSTGGQDSSHHQQGFHRPEQGEQHWGQEGHDMGFRRQDFEARRGQWGHRPMIAYTSEQRKQLKAINDDYQQKQEALFNNDALTLKDYKAQLLALQKERKNKVEALATPEQKERMAKQRKWQEENAQVAEAAHLERMKIRANLTDDQVAKIKQQHADLRAKMKAIHEDETLLPQQKREEMKALMEQQKDAYRSILTQDQQDKLKDMMGHRG